MAYVWFDQLELLEKKAKGTVQNLKTDLSGKTLIGEYIGSQDH